MTSDDLYLQKSHQNPCQITTICPIPDDRLHLLDETDLLGAQPYLRWTWLRGPGPTNSQVMGGGNPQPQKETED